MPYDSNGNYTLPTSYLVENGDTVLPVQHNPPFEDVQVALNAALLRSGVAPMSGNLKMGGFKVTNLAAGTATTDAVNKGQLDLKTLRFVTKGANYTAAAADNATFMRYTGAYTHSLTAAATLGADWWQDVTAYGAAVIIDPNGSETINGATTLTLLSGQTARIVCDGTAFYAQISGSMWAMKGIGEVYTVDTSKAGVSTPPISDPIVTYIELTAGLTGAGQFNENKLTGESVSGSAPLVLATAVISVSGSPMNGQTVRLINTEGRILRPSTSPGTLQDDAFQGHRHLGTAPTNVSGTSAPTISAGSNFDRTIISEGDGTIAGSNGTPRTATETRMKNVGVKAFMRVK